MADTVEDIVEGAVDAVTDPVTLVTAAVAFYFGGPTAAYQVLAASAASGAVTKATMPKPPSLQGVVADDLRGRGIQFRSPVATREIIYGEIKKSGAILHLEATNDNQDLHVLIAMAGHEIESVTDVFFNDQNVKSGGVADATEATPTTGTTPDFSAKAKITPHYGSDTQLADGELVSRTSFTTNHQLRGIAYVYARLTFDADVFATGVPNIQAIVKGKKVFDPRSSTTAWSDNPALCIRDYLTDTRYGLGATSDEIDDTAFIEAANVCDETVTTLAGATKKRYTMNGIVDTSKAPKAIIEDLLTACAGRLVYSNGKYKLLAGEFRTAVKELDEDDLRGGISIQTKNSGQDQFNAVKGVFVSPGDNYQPADFPSITSSTFEAEDNSEQNWLDITLPFTTDVSEAQRLAKIALYRTREQLTLQLPCKLTAFELDVGDTVQITNTRLGFSQKTFEVVSWNYAFGEGGTIVGVDLVVREISAAAYEFDPDLDETVFTTNNTNLPNAFQVSAPGITITDELRTRNEEAISVLVVDVSSSDPFANQFEVQARNEDDLQFVNLGQASGGRYELLNVEDDATYTVRARVVTSLGIRSNWVTGTHQVVGKTAPPEDVTNFAGNVVAGALALTWTPVGDLDLSHYRLRYTSETTGVTYQNSTTLVDKIPRPGNSIVVPARTGTYFIKAVDKLGNASVNPTTLVVSTNIAGVEDLVTINTIEEHPEWNGTFDDVVEIDEDDALVLGTSINFDGKAGNFDAAAGLFDGGGGVVDSLGYYYFGNSFDFGAVYTTRVTVTGSVSRIDYVNTFDEATELFDQRSGDFDGDPNAFDNHDVQLEVRTTSDDPAGTPTWSSYQRFVVGDYTARAMEFRLVLSTTNANSSPKVSAATVKAELSIRTEADDDITSGAGSYAVTFAQAFNQPPAIGISAVMQTGDFYEITSKTRSGFTITFKDSGGTAVSRVFDYVARGYGREET